MSSPVNLAKMKFPKGYVFKGIDLAEKVRLLLRHSLEDWRNVGLLRNNSSYGVVVADPIYSGTYASVWDNPQQLVGFALGDGARRQYYLANAVRKMRAAAREGFDTFAMRQGHLINYFCDEVEGRVDDPENPYPWGDFPWGGAAYGGTESNRWLVGVSGFTQAEDDWIARTVAWFLSTEVSKLTDAR